MAPGLTLPLITFQGRSSRELPSILISKLVRGFFFGSSDILGGKLDHLLLIFFSPFSFPPFFLLNPLFVQMSVPSFTGM